MCHPGYVTFASFRSAYIVIPASEPESVGSLDLLMCHPERRAAGSKSNGSSYFK